MNLSTILARLARPVVSPIQFSWPEHFTAEDWFADDAVGVPLEVGGHRLTQSTPRTCGAMVVLVARMLSDSALRERIELEGPAGAEAEIYAELRRGALGPLTWPAAYGSPPWQVAKALTAIAREGGRDVSYTATPVDADTERGHAILQWIWHAAGVGLPVPVFTGGELTEGLARAVPRHVVLVMPAADTSPELSIYDPGSGSVYRVPIFSMAQRSTPLPAFGHWTRLVWAVLPQPTKE